ncbi:hypothetical protein D3C85_1627040 [compost metagenome]
MENVEDQLHVDCIKLQTETMVGVGVEKLQALEGRQDFRAVRFPYAFPLAHQDAGVIVEPLEYAEVRRCFLALHLSLYPCKDAS